MQKHLNPEKYIDVTTNDECANLITANFKNNEKTMKNDNSLSKADKKGLAIIYFIVTLLFLAALLTGCGAAQPFCNCSPVTKEFAISKLGQPLLVKKENSFETWVYPDGLRIIFLNSTMLGNCCEVNR